MKRKFYTFLAILILVVVYAYDAYLDKQIAVQNIESGAAVKTSTNEFFLPTSTTGQVVHHESYSLSYSEDHEQAEWVAY
ncbi:MAG: DNA/RNA non-specific endonuclease, partial [Oceanihabitans sediminis]|nr:DNA/RNA non-specific endonuclease [Oceanihabitans sediminis]